MRSIPVSENLFQGNLSAPLGAPERVAFDCNGTCNVEYVQHYMLRYYAIRAYKFALEVSNKQSLFGVPH